MASEGRRFELERLRPEVPEVRLQMDRMCIKNADVPQVFQLGLDIFCDTVFRFPLFPSSNTFVG
ncbi:hypothetical protein BC936DRAFT_138367 [Jimgerdemannia flammicorona]|uniref:Uncharacterized protein n=1 Tax=Jimgerdemannia flammicorona TaxID=994334 RepID=A0A433DID2_9FUNG|nr:hypothetical protein BC936DRAFT_138367 [Jimgerdemannia flammicorona]